MANPIKNIGVRMIESFNTAVKKITHVRAKREAPAPAPQIPALPKKTRTERTQSAEQTATEKALWAIQNAMQNPTDKTAQEGRRKAIEYLYRAEQLKGKGKLQEWNREKMAQRWSESDLASSTGQQERKDRKLEIFNQNFNMDLNREQADMIGALMETDTYQQLCESYEGIYGDIIQAMGEAIEDQTDPKQIERTLNLFLQNDIQPEFDTFRKVLDLSIDDFASLEADLYTEKNSMFYQNDDDFGQGQRISSIIGKYIEWM